MRVDWLPQAERSRDDQLDYVTAQNPQAVLDLGDRIRSAVRRLADHPHSGRSNMVERTHQLAVAGISYIVIYRVQAVSVVILHLSRKRNESCSLSSDGCTDV